MFSFDEYRLLLESTAISKVPILFDWDDIAFLVQFPPQFWAKALQWRYNHGLLDSIDRRNLGKPVRDMITLQSYDKGRPGKAVFFHVKTGQNELLDKLTEPIDRELIKNLHKNDKLDQYSSEAGEGNAGRYGYNLDKAFRRSGNNPLDFATGMPIMQPQTANNALSGWIHGMLNGVLGEPPSHFQGEPVFEQTIKELEPQESEPIIGKRSSHKRSSHKKGYPALVGKMLPAIKKDFEYYWVADNKKDQHKVELNDVSVPILLPGKYVPRIKEGYERFDPPNEGGFNAPLLMRNHWNDMTEEEQRHWVDSAYSQEHFIARHKDVTHKNFYVVGGWTPTNLQKGEVPRFHSEDEEDQFLASRAIGRKTWEKVFDEEAEAGVERFIRDHRWEPEGVIMQLLKRDIVNAARANIIKNLGDEKYTPYRRNKKGHEVADAAQNKKNRIKKAEKFAHTVHQANITLFNGTRRLREKWQRQGLDPREQEKEVTGRGSRRWIELTKGVRAGRGWIGSSISYMKRQMGEFDSRAAAKENEAEREADLLVKIETRNEAISEVLERLMNHFYMLQAAWAEQQGQSEDSIVLDKDAALHSAISALPVELDKLGIDYTSLPEDVKEHFKPKEGHAIPAQHYENKGVEILNNLIEKGETEVGGKKITLQDVALNDTVYQNLIDYMDTIKDIYDAKERKAIDVAANTLLNAVNQERLRRKMPVKPGTEPPPEPKPRGMPEKKPEPTGNAYQMVVQSLMDTGMMGKLRANEQNRREFAKYINDLTQAGRLTDDQRDDILETLSWFGGYQESVELPWMFQREKIYE